MGEQRINRIEAEDLPTPEREITPDEARKIRGGILSQSTDTQLKSQEQSQKKSTDLSRQQEQKLKSVGP